MRRNRIARLDIPVASILSNPRQDWNKMSRGIIRTATERKLAVDWDTYTPDRYLMTHCSIVCSVAVEKDGHTIKPPCDELVNTNGNAWTTPVLLATFRTFIGKDNFQEHVQVKALSKGTILDAVARPVLYTGNDGHSTAEVVYIDILVATDRKHADLVDRIERGELNTLSMGTLAHYVQCSRCGKVVDDSMKNCTHLDNELLTHYVDDTGVRRIVAELCGRMIKGKNGEMVADDKSNEFIEASWVEKPAFVGAVVNHFISQMDAKVASAMEFSPRALQDVVNDMFHLRVADKSGMTALKVACKELREQRRQETIFNVVDKFTF